ncbi:MAG: hypothetical protein HOV71_18715 [Hamadaea sp.]|nr:hypothetical protein [Hamadaea sp.]NUR50162.1 hypothetical protein [Hamadaea sp.]NUT03861.1 hypothetical protein [Hamadaea sp.]
MPNRCYEIHVSGSVDDRLLAELPGLTVGPPEIRTVLYGPDLDQSALYGLLDQLQALGLDLVEVRTTDDTGA